MPNSPRLPKKKYSVILGSEEALTVGKAAEHLVCFDLLSQGLTAYLTDQGIKYDIVLETVNELFRVQVKSTQILRNVNSKNRGYRGAYNFNVRRVGKKGNQRLGRNDCGIVAMVALDGPCIAYLPVHLCKTTMQFRPPIEDNELRRQGSRYINDFPIGEIFNYFDLGYGRWPDAHF